MRCDFNKVALLCNFIEITLRHGCSYVNFVHIFRTSFSRNTPGRLKSVLKKITPNTHTFSKDTKCKLTHLFPMHPFNTL